MIILEAWLTCYGVWLFFLLMMQFIGARDAGALESWIVKAHVLPVIAIGLRFYVMLNLTIATVAFLDLPREWQFTKRCQRYIAGESQWPRWEWLMRYRTAVAGWVCKHLLDPFHVRRNGTRRHC